MAGSPVRESQSNGSHGECNKKVGKAVEDIAKRTGGEYCEDGGPDTHPQEHPSPSRSNLSLCPPVCGEVEHHMFTKLWNRMFHLMSRNAHIRRLSVGFHHRFMSQLPAHAAIHSRLGGGEPRG